MPDLASIYQRVCDAVGERARPRRDGEQLQWHATYGHWCYVGHIVATRSHPTDAANAIRCWWEDMLNECGYFTARVKPEGCNIVYFGGEPPSRITGLYVNHYHAPTLIEALAAAVIGECKP